MKVESLMSRDVAVCTIDDNLDVAARLMWERDCGAVPVLDGDDRVVGIITDRDVCMAAYIQGLPLREIPVTTAMAETVHMLRTDDLVVDAERLMAEKQVRRMPVVDSDQHVVGMLALADLIREATRPGHAPNGAMDVVIAMAAVMRPRREPAVVET
jgi:CBS domain-containing protein